MGMKHNTLRSPTPPTVLTPAGVVTSLPVDGFVDAEVTARLLLGRIRGEDVALEVERREMFAGGAAPVLLLPPLYCAPRLPRQTQLIVFLR